MKKRRKRCKHIHSRYKMKIKQRAKRILLDITANVAHHKNKRGKTLSAYNERNYNEIHKS